MSAVPTLYVVATPIGNLADLTPRAQEVLRSVAAICAEDTRRSGQLLAHFGIATPLVALQRIGANGAPNETARRATRWRLPPSSSSACSARSKA